MVANLSHIIKSSWLRGQLTLFIGKSLGSGMPTAEMWGKNSTFRAVHDGILWHRLRCSLVTWWWTILASVIVTTWPKKKERDFWLAPELFGEVCFFHFVFSAICGFLELKATISTVCATFWSLNLSFSMAFATFWCSNCSLRMVFCN